MDFLADASFLQTPLAEGLGLGSDVKSSGEADGAQGFAARAGRCGRTYRGVASRQKKESVRAVRTQPGRGGRDAAAVAILAESDKSRSTAEPEVRGVRVAARG